MMVEDLPLRKDTYVSPAIIPTVKEVNTHAHSEFILRVHDAESKVNFRYPFGCLCIVLGCKL